MNDYRYNVGDTIVLLDDGTYNITGVITSRYRINGHENKYRIEFNDPKDTGVELDEVTIGKFIVMNRDVRLNKILDGIV